LSQKASALARIAILEAALAANPGVSKLSNGDKAVEYDRALALKELDSLYRQTSSTPRLPMTMFHVRPGAAE
jgi:hypothetical protein